MEKEDLEKLEKSQDIQRLLRLAREEYEQEKSDYPPRPFSSLARHMRREERSGRPTRRVSPWWLVAACLLGLIIGRATVTESPASPESGSERLAAADTVVIVRERIDTVYREVEKPQPLLARRQRLRESPSSAGAPAKAKVEEKERREPEYIPLETLRQQLDIPDPESDHYGPNGMTIAEENYPLNLLTAVSY